MHGATYGVVIAHGETSKGVAPLPAPLIVPSRFSLKPIKPVAVPVRENVTESVNRAVAVRTYALIAAGELQASA
jgi:hypothetical protein